MILIFDLWRQVDSVPNADCTSNNFYTCPESHWTHSPVKCPEKTDSSDHPAKCRIYQPIVRFLLQFARRFENPRSPSQYHGIPGSSLVLNSERTSAANFLFIAQAECFSWILLSRCAVVWSFRRLGNNLLRCRNCAR